MERVSCRPDWLDLTVPAEDLAAAHALWVSLGFGPSKLGPPSPHFAGSIVSDEPGLRLSYGGRGGAAGLGSLRVEGSRWATIADPDGLLGLLLGVDGARASRIDLAADFTGAVPTLASVAGMLERHEADTRVRAGRYMRDLATGTETVYIGSDKSPRKVRAYTMRGPLRVEYQARDGWARLAVSAVLAEGSVTAWKAAVGSLVRFPGLGGWTALMAA